MTFTPRVLLVGAAGCVLAFLVLLAVAYGWGEARAVDAHAVEGFIGLQGSRFYPVCEAFVKLGNPPAVALLTALLALVSLARERPRIAIFVVVLVGATSVIGQILKILLAFPREQDIQGIDAEAFPSGHANASMTLAIALVVTMPNRLRPLAAAVGVLFALGVSFSMLIVGGHFPSDIVGGFLTATAISLVLVAGLREFNDRRPEPSGREGSASPLRQSIDAAADTGMTAVLAVAAVLLLLLGFALVVFRLDSVVDYAQDHSAVIFTAAVVVVAALGLLAGMVTALVRRE